MRNLRELCGNRVGDLLATVADVREPQARRRVDVLVTGRIPDVGAFAALDDERTALLDAAHIGKSVPQCTHAQPLTLAKSSSPNRIVSVSATRGR